MSPLEFAIVISAVDQASRVLTGIQEKLEGFARAAESMRAVGEGMTFAGGLMRAAGDVLGLNEATRAAMDFQDEIARVHTVLPPTAEGLRQLGEIEEFAIAQSQRHAYAAKDVAESVYMGLSSFLSASQAMAATTVAEQVAIGTHGQLADVMRTLGTLYLNFGDKTRPAQAEFERLGDTLTTLQTQFAFADMGEITSALQYATAAAQQFHVPFNTALAAIAGFSAAGLHGSEAGTAFAEMMNEIGRGAFEKLGVPLALTRQGTIDLRQSLSNLAAWIRAHPGFGASEALTKAFGIRGARAELLIEQLGKLDEAQAALEHSGGAAARAQALAEATLSKRYEILRNNLEALKERLADLVLPALSRWVDLLSRAAAVATDFLSRHQGIAAVLAKSAVALGLLTTAGGGLLLTLGPILIGGSYLLNILGALPGVLAFGVRGFGALAARALAAWTALAQGEGVMAGLSALLGPWGMVLAAGAALALVGYEIWRHWDAIMPKLVAVWDAIKPEHLFGRLIPEFFTAGAHLVEAVARGIWSAVSLPGRALEAVAQKLRNLLPFSPAREGPLRELERVRIVQTLAETIRPEPLVAAMSAALAPLPMMAATALRAAGAAPARLAVPGWTAPAPTTVTINYAPVIHGTGAEDWVKAARRHADELVHIIDMKLARRERLRFANG